MRKILGVFGFAVVGLAMCGAAQAGERHEVRGRDHYRHYDHYSYQYGSDYYCYPDSCYTPDCYYVTPGCDYYFDSFGKRHYDRDRREHRERRP